MRAGSRSSQSGAALILVLWTFAALTALAGEFARAMREDAQSTRNYKEETISHYVAIAALNEAIIAIQTYNGELEVEDDLDADDDDDQAAAATEEEEEDDPRLEAVERLLLGSGDWIEGVFAGVSYEVRAFEETGKVPLNADVIDEVLLKRIMDNLEYDESVAEIVADSILDWRDEDDLHRTNGAEDQYYQGLKRPYQSKDAPFDAIEELLLIRGITRNMYYGTEGTPGLRDVFTTVSDRRHVTIRAIGPAVEHALCGIKEEDEDEVDDFFGAGSGDDEVDLSECIADTGLGSRRGGREGRPTLGIASIEARVKDAQDRVLTHIGSKVQFRGDSFRTITWYDAIYSDEE